MPPFLFFNPNHGVDHGDDFQRFRRRDLDERIRHQRFASVLLPPSSDEDVVADFADGEFAGGGAPFLAELHDEEITVFDADVFEVFASGSLSDEIYILEDVAGKRIAIAPTVVRDKYRRG